MRKSSTIQLDREFVERLSRLAHATDRSLDEIVNDAVVEYLERQEVDDAAWQERLLEVVGRLRAGVPPDERPEVIEFEITAAREEARAI